MRTRLRALALATWFGLTIAPVAAVADQVSRDGGDVTYVNSRYGTSARFPAAAFPEELPAPSNGDGLAWSSPSGAQLAIYGRPNDGGETPKSVIALRAADDSVTYKASGDRWAVVSGFRDGLIFYERYIFRGDLIHSVSIRYPDSERGTYDRLVGPITNSLRGANAS